MNGIDEGEEFPMLTPPTALSDKFVMPLWESAFSKFCVLTSAAGLEDTAPRRESKKIEIEDRIFAMIIGTWKQILQGQTISFVSSQMKGKRPLFISEICS